MGAEQKKGNDNPKDWAKIEGVEKPIFLKTDEQEKAFMLDESEEVDFEEINTLDSTNSSDDVIDFDDILSNEPENFDEVLQLTEYETAVAHNSNSGVGHLNAEYTDIDIVKTTEKHQEIAKKFVGNITKFILDFKDVELSEKHKSYLKQVGVLQYQHLADLLYLVDINKQMIDNIVLRVNATMVEDYAIVNSYNNLLNQHLKLIKEVQNTYKSIPATIKRMRTEVMCNQELGDIDPKEEELVTEDYGNTQFTSSKGLLRNLLAKKEAESKQ